jgi:hypothetical protein
MSTAQIQQKLQTVIRQGDTRLLKMLYAIAKEYNDEDLTKPGKPMTVRGLRERISASKRIKAGNFTTQETLEKEVNKW